jgi:hypothetical protein
MDAFKEQEQLEKRELKSKEVKIIYTKQTELGSQRTQFFNVIDEEGSLKYDGHFEIGKPSIDDYCSCKSFENGNNSKVNGYYPDTHGHAFQCKHIIKAREAEVFS